MFEGALEAELLGARLCACGSRDRVSPRTSIEGVGVEPRTSSLLATALRDLAAFLGEDVFFADVVNEFSAVDFTFGNHVTSEPRQFRLAETVGQGSATAGLVHAIGRIMSLPSYVSAHTDSGP